MKTNSISNPVSEKAFSFSGLRYSASIILMLFGVVALAQTTSQPSNQAELYEVKGVVLSNDGAPLTGVNIYLKDTNVGTFSDASGKFIFPQRLKAGEMLLFSFVGLKKQEYAVSANMPLSIEIRMEDDPLNILGELWIDAPEKPIQKRRSSAN